MIFQTIVGFEETGKICLQAQRAGRMSAWGNAADVTHGPQNTTLRPHIGPLSLQERSFSDRHGKERFGQE